MIPRNIEDVLQKLTNVKAAGQNKWIADCPVQGHSTPARHLSIENTGTKALVKCFPSGGHTYADICKALGYDTLSYGGATTVESHPVLVATYDYHNVDGNLIYQICRYLPKTFKVRRPDGKGDWLWGMGDVKPVLYHLDEIIASKNHDDVIYVCEGEKDADTAFIRLGTTGTTNPFGAGKWKPEYSEMLRSCIVIVIPDNDPPGQDHCTQVCTSLFGKVKSLKVWRVPAPYKDLTEWVEAGNENVEKITSEAIPFVPAETSKDALPFDWHNYSIEHDALLSKEMKPLEFLVQDFIVIPSTGVLASPKKRGKSWMVLQLAQCVAQGTDFLGLKTQQGSVVYLALEDGERRLKQRLLLQNTIKGLPITYVYKFEPLNSKSGFQQFVELIEAKHPILVVVDTLASAKNRFAKENDAGDMADLINKIHELAQLHNCVILIVAHHGKPKVNEERDAGFDIRGSSAIPGATDFNAGLYKNADGTTDLKVEGRDIVELELRIKFDWEITKTWQLLGDAKDVRRLESEIKIKDAILTLGGSADAAAIAEELGLTRGTIQVQLQRMRDEKILSYELKGTGKGKKIFYSIPSSTSSTSSSLYNHQHSQLPLNTVEDVDERPLDTKRV